jgi:acyl carrier protein
VWVLIPFAIIAVALFAIVWFFDPEMRRTREYEAQLKTRRPLPDLEMISLYFASDEIDPGVPGLVRRLFAKFMNYPAEKLLPDDDFTNYIWADIDLYDLAKDLESEFGITIKSSDADWTAFTIRATSLMIAKKLDRIKAAH